MTINLYNTDCMQALRQMSDNQYDLAIVDPPYGINRSGHHGSCKTKNPKHKRKHFIDKQWDTDIPSAEYFCELCRVLKNQIIWGANYFVHHLKGSMGWIVWDKGQKGLSMSDCELAYSSFQRATRIWVGNRILLKGSIHPTQKPVQLYEWLLQNYAKQGDRILDTHLGSGSIALACHTMGYSLDAYEIDAEYFAAAQNRLNEHQRQLRLFI